MKTILTTIARFFNVRLSPLPVKLCITINNGKMRIITDTPEQIEHVICIDYDNDSEEAITSIMHDNGEKAMAQCEYLDIGSPDLHMESLAERVLYEFSCQQEGHHPYKSHPDIHALWGCCKTFESDNYSKEDAPSCANCGSTMELVTDYSKSALQ